MSVAVTALVIADPEFGPEDLAKLKIPVGLGIDASVVGSLDEATRALTSAGFQLVVHVYRDKVGATEPSDALQTVIQHGGNTPYIAISQALTASHAVDLINSGAADCLAANDRRSVGDVVGNVLGAYRHRPSAVPALSFQQLLNTLGDGVIITDENHRIQSLNQAFCDLTGYEPDQLKGAAVTDFDAGGLIGQLELGQQQGAGWRGEINIRRNDGAVFPAWAVISPIDDSGDGALSGGHSVLISDLTEWKNKESEIRHQASFDDLTELPSRGLLRDRMDQYLAQAKRDQTRVAAMYVDLDFFKEVNDTWGHAMGDQVLIEVAERMRGVLRKSDTVARIGGDEFAVVLAGVDEGLSAEQIATKLLGALERPYMLGGAAAHISASIGIAVYPDHGNTPEALFANADAAMYEVKREGRRGFRMFSDGASGQTRTNKAGLSLPAKILAFISKHITSSKLSIPSLPLVPATLAAAGMMAFVAWMIASGTVTFHSGVPAELISEKDLGSFSTASGAEKEALPAAKPEPETK